MCNLYCKAMRIVLLLNIIYLSKQYWTEIGKTNVSADQIASVNATTALLFSVYFKVVFFILLHVHGIGHVMNVSSDFPDKLLIAAEPRFETQSSCEVP